MRANPLSYGMFELRQLLYPAIDFGSAGFAPSSATCWIITIVFAVLTTIIAGYLMRGHRRADLIT